MKILHVMLVLLWSCTGSQTAPAPEEGAEPSSDGSTTPRVESGAQPDGRAQDSGTRPPVEDRPVAVDAGNPKDVGPEKDGKLKLYLADQAVSDDAVAMMVRIRGVRLEADDGRALEIVLPPTEVDLMQFQEGAKYLLVDAAVETEGYDRVVVLLDDADPATVIFDDGQSFPVDVLSGTGEVALFGAIEPKLPQTTGWQDADVTMHVDLRKQLTLVDGAYELSPVSRTFPSAAVGAIRGFGLEGLIVKAACVYKSTGLLPVGIQTSGCATSDGSATIRNGTFYVGYLLPDTYVLRLFLTDSLYIDVPGVVSVVAGSMTLIDLSPLTDLIGDLLNPLGL